MGANVSQPDEEKGCTEWKERRVFCETQINKIEGGDRKMYDGLLDGSLQAKFEFENLVLEGGGAKGLAYIGMIKALEDTGLLVAMEPDKKQDKGIKRFAGASIGALVATHLATGAGAAEVYEFFEFEGSEVEEASVMEYLPNIIKKYGMNTGKSALEYYQNLFLRKFGTKSITFEQLYKKRGVELCIIVSNISTMREEYCHVKTTPNMEIAFAISMTMALPPIFQPIKVHVNGKNKESFFYYSDGGILNNYPISAFDGWYLSLDPKYSFFKMFGENKPKFETLNNKTIGAVVFSRNDDEFVYNETIKRLGRIPRRPKTKISKKKETANMEEKEEWEKKTKLSEAALQLMNGLNIFVKNYKKSDLDGNIDKKEFLQWLAENPENLPAKSWKILFEDKSKEEAFNEIDENSDGKLSFDEVLWFIEKQGVVFGHHMETSVIQDYPNFSSFMMGLVEAMRKSGQRRKYGDAERTIGLYTDYLETTDFNNETDDKQFVMKLGWLATVSYFREKLGLPKLLMDVNDSIPIFD